MLNVALIPAVFAAKITWIFFASVMLTAFITKVLKKNAASTFQKKCALSSEEIESLAAAQTKTADQWEDLEKQIQNLNSTDITLIQTTTGGLFFALYQAYIQSQARETKKYRTTSG